MHQKIKFTPIKKNIKLLPPELFLLAQICTKSFVGWGFAPDPLAGLRGPTSKGGEGKGGRGGKGSGGEGREGKGRGGECPPWT